MSEIEKEQIRIRRDTDAAEAVRLREEIKQLQEKLLICEARVNVYNELLESDNQYTGTIASIHNGVEVETPRKRAARTTKAEMLRRKKLVALIFLKEGDMTPKDLLPLVQEELDLEMEAHHLRAILRRFEDTFVKRPEKHGIWGLTAAATQELSED